eukprot:COSAG04_NODE_13665_length_596_cov_1.376258_1_plen_145_part_01
MLQSTDTMFQSADSPAGLPTPKGRLTSEQRQARQERDYQKRQERMREQEQLRRQQQIQEEEWLIRIALPTATLVTSMTELSAWGPAMGFAFVGCICTALSMVPTAVAMDSATMFVFVAFVFVFPLTIAYAPASVRILCCAAVGVF